MNINASETKECLISFSKCSPVIPHITIGGEEIVRVKTCKLLGVELNNLGCPGMTTLKMSTKRQALGCILYHNYGGLR